MTNKKSTKRALLASVLSLFLCLSMLIGTTFAWFTDSVTSANNVITAGNLDLTLEYWNGTEWVDVEGSSEILDKDALWEPGYTEVVYFKLENAGSLALKYQMGVNILEETAGVNVAGESFLLSDYIYFDVVEGVNAETSAYATREEAMAMATETTVVSDGYAKAGELLANAEPVYLAMIVYMPTTVGNVANHNGTDVPEIQLGVNAIATQFTAEEDSFDKMYDEDAVFFSAVASNEAELVEALANAKNNDVIGISGNVTWTTGAGIGSTPFVTNATFVTLKGVDENATLTALGSGVGAIGIDNGTVVFDGLTIVDQSVSYAENSWEYGYLEFRGTTVFNNCDVVNAIMMEGDSATFVDCTFNSYDDNQYAVWVSEGRANFDGCTFNGARGLKIHEAYGSEVETVKVNSCYFVDLTKKPGVAIGDVNADTAIALTNNVFVGTQAGDQGLYTYETDTDVTTFTFVDENNKVLGAAVTNNTELKAAVTSNATVYLSEGEYSMPSLSGKENVTIIGAEGTVIGGNTATGYGSNFGKNTVIKNVTFKGTTNGVRYSYAQGGDTVFEYCTFEGDSTYGFHIDQSYGATFTFNNCTFVGFNAFASDLVKVVFNNCTFLSNGNYGHTNIWSIGEFNGCFFGPNTSVGPRGDGKVYIDGEEVSFYEA